MRCCLYLRLDGLYLRTLGLENQPALVHREGLLVDVARSARERGVGPQLTLKEAKMILLENGVYVEFNEADYREAAEKWLSVLLKYSDAIQPITPASVFVDLSKHPDPFDIASLLLSDLFRKEDLPIQAGIASARWLAQVSAQPCSPESLWLGMLPVEPVLAPKEWLGPRRILCLAPLPSEVLTRFSQLGIQFVREVQELPLRVLENQFPGKGRWIRKVAEGSLSDPVEGTWPPSSFSCELLLERCESEIELDEALRSLAIRAAHRLCTTDQAASKLKLYVQLESDRFMDAERTLKKQTQAASQLYTLFKQLLSKFQIDEPVQQIRIWLLDLKKSTRQQTSFAYGKESDSSQLKQILSRLQDAYGTRVIFPASEYELDREKRVLKAWKEAYGWR